MMGLDGSEINLTQMLMKQESQSILDQGNKLDNQKKQQQMDQQKETQQTIQKILAQQAAGKQPVTNEVSGKLMQMSARQEEQAQVKEWQDKFQTNMQIAEALASTDHVAAAEYRKEALGYKSMATNYAKGVSAEKKDRAKDEGSVLNVAWQSQEGYDAALKPGGSLDQVNPELAEKLRQKFGPTLNIGAARELQAEANSRMSIEQQQSKAIAVQKVIDDREHKLEMERQGQERLADQRSRMAQTREAAATRKQEKQTLAQKANATFAKAENAHQDDYDKDYYNAHKDYLAAKKVWEKAKGGEAAIQAAKDMQEAVDAELAANKRYVDNVNKARSDAREAGATTLRAQEDLKPKAVQPTKNETAYPNAPKVGFIKDGYKYLGGDPTKQESWGKV